MFKCNFKNLRKASAIALSVVGMATAAAAADSPTPPEAPAAPSTVCYGKAERAVVPCEGRQLDDHYQWYRVPYATGTGAAWVDVPTGLAWAEESAHEMPFKTAQGYCERIAKGLPQGFDFGLPSEEEFRDADVRGLQAVLGMGGRIRYWTATETRRGDVSVFRAGSGAGSEMGTISREEPTNWARARCVGTSLAPSDPHGPDLDYFKSELRDNVRDLNGDALSVFDPHFNVAIRSLRSIKDTSEYEVCTDPSWYHTKKRQQEACLNVAEAVKRAPRDDHEGRARRNFEIRLDYFDFWIRKASAPEHRDFALRVRNALVEGYNSGRREIENYVGEYDGETRRECFHKEMGAAIRCSIDRTIKYLEDDLPSVMKSSAANYSRESRAAALSIRQFWN